MILPRKPNSTTYDAIISIQAQIRAAIMDETDEAARSLDQLLQNRPELQALAVYVAYKLHPYEVRR
jgi:hypothetical protein